MGRVVTREHLREQLAPQRARGARIVFTNGIFDLLHLGHLRYLQRARSLGDLLVVGVNSDESARQLKGPARPLVPATERAELLAALDCVDYVTIFGEPTAEATLALLRPEVYVKGADYANSADRQQDTLLTTDALRQTLASDSGLGQRLPEARIVADYGGSLALLAYLPGHSTSELIDRIVARYGTDDGSAAG
ncbi:MAG TPA: adenylyltransferase/cytidyltransferase family protein [Ktedonobacterales bacterium]|nr:adenylyltransferase/cytidyltransferase family protein [Ktedonobacterales bacterium]